MVLLRRVVAWVGVSLFTLSAVTFTADSPLTEFCSVPTIRYPATQFLHATGAGSPRGWHADFRVHTAGYLLSGLPNGGDVLGEGTYRYDFYFARRSGTLRHWLSGANDVARVEAFDATTGETVVDRTFQNADFPSSAVFRKTLLFSTWARPGHHFEPRVYWPGLSGLFISRVDIHRLEDVSLSSLVEKGQRFEDMMPTFLDRGYVVGRSLDGHPEDIGDAAIWTGLYVAAEAWRYQATGDAEARHRMETSLWALHRLHTQSTLPGTLVRYIDADGVALPEPPSKDTYTGFYFGVSQALPWVADLALRDALRQDIFTITTRLLDHDLRLESPLGDPVDFNPSIPVRLWPSILDHLRHHPKQARRAARALEELSWYLRVTGTRPARLLLALAYDLRRPDELASVSEIDVLNGLLDTLRALRRVVHRSAVAGRREQWPGEPYAKLDRILQRALGNLDRQTEGGPVVRFDQIKVLPSESLHALHLVRVAAELFPKPNRFDTFYNDNLAQHEALLTTALEWSHIDEQILEATRGETYADVSRTGSSHLTFLALYDLLTLERRPVWQEQYETIFERQMQPMRADANAMLQVMEDRIGWRPRQLGLALWALERYPIDRQGRGESYWRAHRDEWLAAFGGEVGGQAREPIPVNWRPRDAFVWQRSARSIRGDNADWCYPPVDFLFAYWMARANTEPHGGNEDQATRQP